MKYQHFQNLRRNSQNLSLELGFDPINSLLIPLISIQPSKQSEPLDLRKRIINRLERELDTLRFRLLKEKKVSLLLQKADIVFFVTEPTHLKQCVPIGRALQENNKSTLYLSTKKELCRPIQKAGLKAYYLSWFFSSEMALQGYYKLVDDLFIKTNSNLARDEELISRWKRTIKSHGKYLLGLKRVISQLLHENKDQLWVLGNDLSRDGRLIAQLLKDRAIKLFSVQHGTIPDDPIHHEHLVNKILVFGQAARRQLESKGINSERIIVTGAPYLDQELSKDRSAEIRAIRSLLGVQKDSAHNVLIAFSGAGQRTSLRHHKMMIQVVFNLAKQHANYNFIFKLHRKDKMSLYQEYPATSTIDNLFFFDGRTNHKVSNDLFDWLGLADTVITSNSASGAEAILFDKTVFSLDLLEEYAGVDYRDAGASIAISSEQELFKAFGAYINGKLPPNFDSSKAEFITDYFHSSDGQSVRRCVQALTSSMSS